jgi:hypothetical protein
MGYFKELDIELRDQEIFKRDKDQRDKLMERLREGEFDRRFEDKFHKPEDCPDCGGFGYTIEKNSHGEYIQNCFRCWREALDADEGAQK